MTLTVCRKHNAHVEIDKGWLYKVLYVTEVALIGNPETNIRAELLGSDTASAALRTYTLTRPFQNAIGVETVSLGSAIALLNDIDWHLKRVADQVLLKEASIDDTEWLSRALATAVRNERVPPEATGEYVLIYGLHREHHGDLGRLVEPLYARRTDGTLPEYDLRDVKTTVTVRITEAEFKS